MGDQPWKLPSGITRAPSAMRRETARISAIVISAVSSVSTPGVLVTAIPLVWAAATSIWSTPLPKLAISFNCSPAAAMTSASISSVTVGTRTCAVFTASINSSLVMGRSSILSAALNSSRIRVSIVSGRRRVTTICGFCFMTNVLPRQLTRLALASLPIFNVRSPTTLGWKLSLRGPFAS